MTEIDECEGVLAQLFLRENALFPGYDLEGPPEILVSGRLFCAQLHESGKVYEVTVFREISRFVGELWERAARTLVHFAPLQHPALPKVEMIKSVPKLGLAFTMTEVRGRPLDVDRVVRWAKDHRAQTFEQFTTLLDALKALHGARYLHRCLLPDALRGVPPQDGRPLELSLARFEMSMLVGNIVRRVARHEPRDVRQVIRELYLGSPNPSEPLSPRDRGRRYTYLAPEMHGYLFADERAQRDWDRTDMFGLGAFGWELFCGTLPETLSSEFAAVQAAAGALDTADTTDVLPTVLYRLHEAMRDHLRRNADLPEPLRDVLLRMIDNRPDGRQTSFEAADALTDGWEEIFRPWERGTPTAPLLVAFLPAESTPLYEERQWISRPPDEPAGSRELQEFLAWELRRARLVRSVTGARGYATGPDELLADAEWVLIGERALWFCTFLKEYEFDGTVRRQHKEVLLIKYVVEHARAPELYGAHPRREVSAVEIIPFQSTQRSVSVKDRPSWWPLAESLRLSVGRSERDQRFLNSLEFLLDYQWAQLDGRVYPYELDPDDQEVMCLDRRRDDGWRHRSTLFTAYTQDQGRRPTFGDFVASLDDDEEFDATFLQVSDSRGKYPRWGQSGTKVRFLGRLDDDRIQVRAETAGGWIPPRGWIRPFGDIGTHVQMRRQWRAWSALQNQPGLIRNLRDPLAYDLGGRFAVDDNRVNKLRGNAKKIIRDMQNMHPIYALQGPPGSGKTTSAAHAVRMFLNREFGARILISAQSNFALDNLAEALVEQLGDEILVLRETSERDGEAKVSPAIQEHTLARLAEKVRRNARKVLTEARREDAAAGLPDATDPQVIAQADELRRRWLRELEGNTNVIELTERVRTGASVVLATCSIAATIMDRTRRPDERFDWVMVEEAAKAWPTELVVPLVQGSRWTLIGDHLQLGAHRADDLSRFLDSLVNSRDPAVHRHHEDKKQHMAVLSLLKTYFDDGHADGSGDEDADGRHDEDAAAPRGERAGYHAEVRDNARGRLNRQFRMHPDIAEPVRRTFYPKVPEEWDGELRESFLHSDESARRDHGVIVPKNVQGHALIWVDTTGVRGCNAEPRWLNSGEAALIEQIVKGMEPAPLPPGEHGDRSLAVLTPYRAQVAELNKRPSLNGRVHTVHSFQGHEADRVLVSLVRSHSLAGGVARNVGHAGQDEVVNVLMSRARRLMILVGGLEHFENNGGDSWARVVAAVRRYGTVVPAAELEY